MAEKIKIKLVKSIIGQSKTSKRTVEALGFKKLNQIIEKEATPQIIGMVNSVEHLVKVIE